MRVAPLGRDEPTAMPYSPVGAYFQFLGVGEIELTGHPKEKRHDSDMSGGCPVTSSWGVEGRLSHSFLWGRRL